ncbi:hypothetical protein BV898_03255 [Hypsibius exemplaris]|uniref:Uncharacterized protein n=1 Tax=Hypsibius exemplaris TaxID=2072580 RepID=A0A1W0X681_HYPEX|nr:hypothetical protein BV898_03255 [Hypsibius exemplaris]
MSQQIRLSSQAVFFNIVAIFAAVSSFHGVWAFSCYQCRGDGICDVPTEAMKTDCTSPLGTIHTCIKAVVDAKTIRACGVPEVTIH